MICVGLTGGIGSGKSYIAQIFNSLGIPVYEADSRAMEITNTIPSIRKKIISIFGEQAYQHNKLNRKWIGDQVFDHPSLLQKLNDIIHPEVDLDFAIWCSENTASPYLIKEAAILFETGSYSQLNFNILVTAPDNLRIARVSERDQMSPDQIRKRMQNQWSDEDKLKLADFVIINDGEALILPQIINIHEKLIKMQ